MRNFVRSETYARTRVGIGVLAAIFGTIVIVRMFLLAGIAWQGLPGYVLGLAMIGLGIVRIREYALARRQR